jgi:alpha-tubulin suppressor-like RCC1 family protein
MHSNTHTYNNIRIYTQRKCRDDAHTLLVRVSLHPSMGKRVTKVTCAHHHTLMLLDNGMLLGWGRNDMGQLGLGRRQVLTHVLLMFG